MCKSATESAEDGIEACLRGRESASGAEITYAVKASKGCSRASIERARAVLIRAGFVKAEWVGRVGRDGGKMMYRWVDDPGASGNVDEINITIRSDWERICGTPVCAFDWIVNNLMGVRL